MTEPTSGRPKDEPGPDAAGQEVAGPEAAGPEVAGPEPVLGGGGAKARRWLPRLLVALAAAVLLVAFGLTGGAVVMLRAPFPDTEGTLLLPGLSAPVTVYRDDYGIPQVYADTATDLFRAQGFVHAQDRFWEMDFRRHVTSGRLAELFGPDQIDTDRFLRVLGWRQVAQQEYELLPARERSWLDAYAAGVNAYLADRSPHEIAIQYSLLRAIGGPTEIEDWAPVDSLAWLKAMAWDLSGNGVDELDRARLVRAGLPADRVEQLYPRFPYDLHRPIVTDGAVVNGRYDASAGDAAGQGQGAGSPLPPVLPADSGAAVAAADDAFAAAAPMLDKVLGPLGSGIGSNSFAISAARSATGHPILANDPHLGPSMPSLWHQIGLHCVRVSESCPFDVTGFGFSGTPGVVIGHNGRIAWGFTNLGTDVQDLFVERVQGDNYQVGDQWRSMSVRRERIEVAGGDPVMITVRGTEHGPLVSDVSADYAEAPAGPTVAAAPPPTGTATTAGYAVALRWTALAPGTTAQALFGLNAATDWQSFRDAVQLFVTPAQNIIYADVDGHIGYQAPGTTPIRGRGDGRWPVPGWDPQYDWVGYVPFEALPWALDPAVGYIVTANQAVAGPSYPYLLTTDWNPGYRSQRLTSLIQGQQTVSTDLARTLMMDNHNGNAAFLVPALRRVTFPEGSTAERAGALFDGWDYQQSVDSAPAAFFAATWRQLLALVIDDEVPDDLHSAGDDRYVEVIRNLLDQPDSPWWDDRSTLQREDRDDALAAAMIAATDELVDRLGDDPARWRWGALHTLTVRDSTFGTSGIGPVEWLVNRGPYELGGGNGIPNATGWSSDVGYEVNWLPSMRMVIDMGDLNASRWINLTGASGHPFHPHYNDQFPLWRDGELLPMRWGRVADENSAKAVLRLQPEA